MVVHTIWSSEVMIVSWWWWWISYGCRNLWLSGGQERDGWSPRNDPQKGCNASLSHSLSHPIPWLRLNLNAKLAFKVSQLPMSFVAPKTGQPLPLRCFVKGTDEVKLVFLEFWSTVAETSTHTKPPLYLVDLVTTQHCKSTLCWHR